MGNNKRRKIEDKMRYAVDIPNSIGDEWICIEYFETKKEALKFAKDKFGADKNGKVNLISNL